MVIRRGESNAMVLRNGSDPMSLEVICIGYRICIIRCLHVCPSLSSGHIFLNKDTFPLSIHLSVHLFIFRCRRGIYIYNQIRDIMGGVKKSGILKRGKKNQGEKQ